MNRSTIASLLDALGRRDAGHALRVADVLDIGCDHRTLHGCGCGPRGPLTEAERARVGAPTPKPGRPNARGAWTRRLRDESVADMLGWTVEDYRAELALAVAE